MGCTSIKDPVEDRGATVGESGSLHVEVQNSLESAPLPVSTADRAATTAPSSSGELFAAYSGRRQFEIQNLSTTDALHIRFGSAAATTSDLRLNPGERYTSPPGVSFTGAIQIIAASGSPPYVAYQYPDPSA